MAENVSNTASPPSLLITSDTGVDNDVDDNVSSNKTDSSDTTDAATESSPSNDKEPPAKCSEKVKESVIKPSSFLRPSALSAETFKTSNANSPAPKLSLSSNKFACVGASPESVFGFPSEKKENNQANKSAEVPAFGLQSNSEAKETISPLPVTPFSNPNYVFGQNLLARVADRPESISNGTGGMLFSAVLNAGGSTATANDADSREENGEATNGSSLLEDAARCQEQRALKRKYDEVQVTTGEEDEKNVLQVLVKLFAFEAGVWVERGRGTLRLNDSSSEHGSSRIVVRTLGSLRVVLNTKIWAGMELSRASDKSIRTTAMDAAGQLKIFLIQTSLSDAATLYSSLERRLRRCQAEESRSTQVSSVGDKGTSEAAEESKLDDTKDEKENLDDSTLRPAKAPALDT